MNSEDLQSWGIAPNMGESQHRKFTTPNKCSWDSTQKGDQIITEAKGAVETFVGTSPNTVVRMSTFRLTKYVVEPDL